MGFAPFQTEGDNACRIIQCGSRKITATERNYAIIELECAAISWAISKCEYFLKGIPEFEVITDHRPLIGTFNKPLSQIENSRLVRIREKVMDYNFSISWRAVKTNLIADALSRAPSTSENPTPVPIRACHITQGPITDIIINKASTCPIYREILDALINKVKATKLPPSHPGSQLKDVWNRLSVSEEYIILLDGERIYVPKQSRQTILQQLHQPHCGQRPGTRLRICTFGRVYATKSNRWSTNVKHVKLSDPANLLSHSSTQKHNTPCNICLRTYSKQQGPITLFLLTGTVVTPF